MTNGNDAIYSVWLYGSHARGDWDHLSDLDVFVAGAPPRNVLDWVVSDKHVPSLSQYTWDEIGAMAEYGSLFLHHLRAEGKHLLDAGGGTARLTQIFERLSEYRLFRRDIRAFHSTVLDAKQAEDLGSTPEFEMAVLGTVLRHSSVLACYLIGQPCFSRTGAIERAADAFGFTSTEVEAFKKLYLFRLHEDGRCDMPFMPTWAEVIESCGQVETFLFRLNGVANAFENRLSATDC